MWLLFARDTFAPESFSIFGFVRIEIYSRWTDKWVCAEYQCVYECEASQINVNSNFIGIVNGNITTNRTMISFV